MPGAINPITIAGVQPEDPEEFYYPVFAYVAADGTTYVVDPQRDQVQKWTPGATEGITVAGGNGDGKNSNQFDWPTGVYVDINGNIFVEDTKFNHRIQKWAPGATEGITVLNLSK